MDNKKSCNSNIQCTVNSCAYHNPQNYCSLSQIKVGCTDASPSNGRETECASVELKSGRRKSPAPHI